MSGRIYFVGGASGSGKSVATRQMARECTLPRLEVDNIYSAFCGAFGNSEAQKIITIAAASLVEELVASGASMIVDGGWIWPDKAADLVKVSGGRLTAVYCGYPTATTQGRFELIRSNSGPDPNHWLAGRDSSDAIAWINQQIEGSRSYQEAAKLVGLPFFDFSDVAEGNKQLRAHFRQWLEVSA